MVSVFPVPVGMTTVARSSVTLQWAIAACRAPICGGRNPRWTTAPSVTISSRKTKLPCQD